MDRTRTPTWQWLDESNENRKNGMKEAKWKKEKDDAGWHQRLKIWKSGKELHDDGILLSTRKSLMGLILTLVVVILT